MSHQRLAAAAAVIMLGNIASRLLGLIREQVMAALFGATAATDAFVAASTVPTIVYDLLVGGAISAALVPVFVDYADDEARLWEVASAVLTLAAALLGAIVAILALLAPQLIWLLGTGFDPDQQAQAASMVRVMLVGVVLQGLAGVLMAMLNARQHFALPAFSPAVYNGAIILAALALHPVLGVEALVAGVVLGAAVQLVLQASALQVWRFRPAFGLTRPEVRTVLRLYAPVALGMVVTIIGIVIDRNLASRLDDGSMTIMGYATRLIQFPLGLIGVALSSAVLPTLTAHASAVAAGEQQRLGEYRLTLLFGVRLILFLMIPALVGLVLLREPLVRLVFERGQFSELDTARTALVFLAYAPQLPFTALDQLLIVAFYARKDTRTPVLVGAVTVGMYLATALALISPLGAAGLALANAVQNSAHGIILFGLLQRALGQLVNGELIGFLARVVLASAGLALLLIGVLTWMPALHGSLAQGAALGLAIVLAALVYLVLASALRLSEARLLLGLAWRRRADREP